MVYSLRCFIFVGKTTYSNSCGWDWYIAIAFLLDKMLWRLINMNIAWLLLNLNKCFHCQSIHRNLFIDFLKFNSISILHFMFTINPEEEIVKSKCCIEILEKAQKLYLQILHIIDTVQWERQGISIHFHLRICLGIKPSLNSFYMIVVER